MDGLHFMRKLSISLKVIKFVCWMAVVFPYYPFDVYRICLVIFLIFSSHIDHLYLLFSWSVLLVSLIFSQSLFLVLWFLSCFLFCDFCTTSIVCVLMFPLGLFDSSFPGFLRWELRLFDLRIFSFVMCTFNITDFPLSTSLVPFHAEMLYFRLIQCIKKCFPCSFLFGLWII